MIFLLAKAFLLIYNYICRNAKCAENHCSQNLTSLCKLHIIMLMYKYIPIYVCAVYMCMCAIYVCTQTYIERDGLTYKCLCVWNVASSLEVSWGEFLKLSWNGKAFLSWKLSIWRKRLINLVTFIGFIFSEFFF